MTEVEVGEYADLQGDAVIKSRAKDAVLRELSEGASAVLRLEDWLVSEKSFESIEGIPHLFTGRVIAETEKAYLFTQDTESRDPSPDQPGTDWVPKGYARVYLPKDDLDDGVDDSTPQAGLFDFD